IKVFLGINAEEQMRRVRARNGERMAEIFENKWIPMEKLYFTTYDIAYNCEYRFSSNQRDEGA
ncbi:MAG: hypothetical protein FWD01_00160, partial [Defluviitaleaceae bacterium]|nr:hypothetical protein [Defluviitaleaceae bacterium]